MKKLKKKPKVEFKTKIVKGRCEGCELDTLLVCLDNTFYRCISCGEDLEQTKEQFCQFYFLTYSKSSPPLCVFQPTWLSVFAPCAKLPQSSSPPLHGADGSARPHAAASGRRNAATLEDAAPLSRLRF